MNNEIKGILIQDGTPTPDNPLGIKNLIVNEEAEKYIESLQEKNKRLLKKSYKDDVIITKITEIINNLKPLTEEETGIKEMLKLAYSADNIKNLETSFKAMCHLEDFEIAIWNIKDILNGDDKSE